MSESSWLMQVDTVSRLELRARLSSRNAERDSFLLRLELSLDFFFELGMAFEDLGVEGLSNFSSGLPLLGYFTTLIIPDSQFPFWLGSFSLVSFFGGARTYNFAYYILHFSK